MHFSSSNPGIDGRWGNGGTEAQQWFVPGFIVHQVTKKATLSQLKACFC